MAAIHPPYLQINIVGERRETPHPAVQEAKPQFEPR
jgi:hypothetical protein